MSLRGKLIAVILLLLVGIGILIYPTLSDYVNSLDGSFAIRDLENQIAQAANSELMHQRSLAEQYNTQLPDTTAQEDYDGILDFGGGLMGYIQIPKIEVNLPIFHGVSEETLAKGVGHLPGSAFPIGGKGNHAVLTGHTGLPSAVLFTDLTELQEGDVFSIHILDDILLYRVDQILVVQPSESEQLSPVTGEDYCTLVTCTPYGINSHRLLVRGSRVVDPQEIRLELPAQETVRNEQVPPGLIAAAIAVIALLIGLAIVIFKQKI